MINSKSSKDSNIIIFMCGDVMTGRGVDQVLPHPGNPVIHEPYVKDAREYVELAEKVNGPVQKPISFSYIWGDTLVEFDRLKPDIKLINLETSITGSDDYWEGKIIHYRMHPENIHAITSAGIDYCSLANNHILDWGYSGLRETLTTLGKADIKSAGAGMNIKEAEAPAVIEIEEKGRVIVFSYGLETSGIYSSWSAGDDKPGINLLNNMSDRTVRHIKESVRKVKRNGDIAIASIHWGSNWGYEIPDKQREFTHKLIDGAGFDIIHGHSSHHVKAIEVYRNKLVIYGCGDFLTDYEGIPGYEDFRDDLGLMYFASMDQTTGRLSRLQMIPTQIKNFRVNRATSADVLWLKDVLNREGKKFGTHVKLEKDKTLLLQWNSATH